MPIAYNNYRLKKNGKRQVIIQGRHGIVVFFLQRYRDSAGNVSDFFSANAMFSNSLRSTFIDSYLQAHAQLLVFS